MLLLAERFLTPRISSSVQNGSVHQKDGLNDDDFEPYLSPQARPVSELSCWSSAVPVALCCLPAFPSSPPVCVPVLLPAKAALVGEGWSCWRLLVSSFLGLPTVEVQPAVGCLEIAASGLSVVLLWLCFFACVWLFVEQMRCTAL